MGTPYCGKVRLLYYQRCNIPGIDYLFNGHYLGYIDHPHLHHNKPCSSTSYTKQVEHRQSVCRYHLATILTLYQPMTHIAYMRHELP